MPSLSSVHIQQRSVDVGVDKPTDGDGLILEAWAQGYMVGSLIIMAFITIANMRRRVLLHKLILLELILGCFMGTFIFPKPPVYSWYLSATAVPLNVSWCLHNVISWMKIKPFLSKRWSWVFIISVCLSFPYWVVEIYANFTFFNKINDWFLTTRPYEALFRDPWWIFTTAFLFYQIGAHYRIKLTTLVWISPRFGVLLFAMLLSVAFIILDILSVTHVFKNALPDGLNPFWKLSTVFKCLTDSIVLDDFKTALDRLMRNKMRREGLERMQLDVDATSGLSPCNNGGDAYSQWTFMTRDTAARNEDPLGEDHLERRMTSDTSNWSTFLADLDKERALSGTTRTESDLLPPVDETTVGLGVTHPPIAHLQQSEQIGLSQMLAEDRRSGVK